MSLELYDIPEVIQNAEISTRVDELARASTSVYRMYGTIDWLKASPSHNDTTMLCYRPDGTEIANILTFRKGRKTVEAINYGAFRFRVRLMSADAVCCEPLGLVNEDNYRHMINGLFERYPDMACIYIKSITMGSEIYDCLARSAAGSGSGFFCCPVSGPRDFHTLSLKGSFDEYLALFSKKERYNLKRQCRLAREASGGELTLEPIASPQDIDYFASCAQRILGTSWKSNMGEAEQLFSAERCMEYANLARNGLLRSYVLLGNGEPWAFILGYQSDGVYHYSNVAYVDARASLSPGTVLFYLMLEDLHSHDKPDILSFGIGNSFYKRRFGTDKSIDCTLLVVRDTIRNRLLAAGFTAVTAAKQMIKRVRTASSDPAP